MRRPSRPPVFAVLAAVTLLAVGAAGCASGGGGGAKAATTTTTAVATTLPTGGSPASGEDTSGAISSDSEAALAKAPKVDPVLQPLPAPGRLLDIVVGGSGFASLSSWPDACTLLSDAQLLTLVPAAASVTTEGQPGRVFDGGQTPHPTRCTYQLAFPPPEDVVPGTVIVELRNVASAEILTAVYNDRRSAASDLAKGHPGLFADYGTKIDGASCFFDGAMLECVAGNYSFWVGGADPRAAAAASPSRADEWRNRVLARVVVLLTERMVPASASDSAGAAVVSS